MQEEKVEVYVGKHKMEHLTYDLELSIVEHEVLSTWA